MPSAGRLTRDDTKHQCQTTDSESALRSGVGLDHFGRMVSVMEEITQFLPFYQDCAR